MVLQAIFLRREGVNNASIVNLTQREKIMRKTLLAVALLVWMGSGVRAAEVSVYGVIDMGLSFSRQGGDNGDNNVSVAMKSGMRNSSRFGFKGSEDLGNGYKMGFILESQFLTDDGQLQTSGRLWERES